MEKNLMKHKRSLIKSKKRIIDHGEVFTPSWLVKAMLNLVEEELLQINSRFLEPACGSGNFLTEVLKRKLAAVKVKYGKSDFDLRHYALLALMSIYGIELLMDNIEECQNNLLKIYSEFLGINEKDIDFKAASFVLSQNIVNADAISMLTLDKKPISFAEWGYLGKGKYQRRDFRFDVLTHASEFSRKDSLFANLGKEDIFIPIKTYKPENINELAKKNKKA